MAEAKKKGREGAVAGRAPEGEKNTITVGREVIYAAGIVILILLFAVALLAIPKIQPQPAQAAQNTTQQPAQPTVPFVTVSYGNLPPLGNPSAPVSLIEFTDYQCPFCERFYSGVEQAITADYVNSSKVKLFHRDLPLGFHDKAYDAAMTARCANEQGKFWEMRGTLMSRQQEWSILLQPDAVDRFASYASDLGLNATEFDSCYANKTYASQIKEDGDAAAMLGISATPTFAIVVPKSMAPELESNFSSVRALLPASFYSSVRLAQDSADYVVVVEGAQPYPVFKAIFDNVNY